MSKRNGEKAEEAARNQQIKTLHGLIRGGECNERQRQSGTILDKDDDPIIGREETKKQWGEHLEEVLNRQVRWPVRASVCNTPQNISDVQHTTSKYFRCAVHRLGIF